MTLPPFVYVKKFWEAVCLLIAGILALVAFFGYIPMSYALGSQVLLVWILALLRFFGIEPQLRTFKAPKK